MFGRFLVSLKKPLLCHEYYEAAIGLTMLGQPLTYSIPHAPYINFSDMWLLVAAPFLGSCWHKSCALQAYDNSFIV